MKLATAAFVLYVAALAYAALAKVIQLAVGDRWTLVRAVILFGGATLVLFAWMIRRLTIMLAGDEIAGLEASANGDLANYVDQRGIRVLIDWPYMIESWLPAEYIARHWRPCDHVVLSPDNVCLVRRQP